jgi:predicted TPR repeat methyltransferase
VDSATFDRAKSLFLDGVSHLEAGRLEPAEAAFEASLVALPGRASTLTNLGAVRLALGKTESALQALDASLQADPRQADACCHRGLALLRLQRIEEAVPCFERAAELQGELLAAWYHLGCARNLLHQHVQALSAFERLLATDAASGDAWFRHGQTLQALDRHDDALCSYDRALALDDTLVQAQLNRAGILKDKGQRTQAAAAYRDALRHGADAELVAFYLAALEGSDAPARMPRAYVQGLFDDYAAQFDQHLVQVLHYQGHVRLVDGLRQAFGARRYAHALDLGCGTGLAGVELRHVAARIDGVDLSAPMLERARALQLYERLDHADLLAFLQMTERRYDLIAAADVFTYVGELDAVFAAVPRVLEPGGVWCFAVEDATDGADVVLRSSLRYAHSSRYLHALAQRHGFTVAHEMRWPMREDQRRTIEALYIYLSR